MSLTILIFALLTFPMLIALWIDHHQFKKSTYKKETGNRYKQVRLDKGLDGEYQT